MKDGEENEKDWTIYFSNRKIIVGKAILFNNFNKNYNYSEDYYFK